MTKPADKAPHGQPCTNCGRCCEQEVCPLGMTVFFGLSRDEILAMGGAGFPGPCPALTFTLDGRSQCGVAMRPEMYHPAGAARYGRAAMSGAAAHLLAVGKGCDARFAGEKQDREFLRRGRSDAETDEHLRKSAVAMVMWGMS